MKASLLWTLVIVSACATQSKTPTATRVDPPNEPPRAEPPSLPATASSVAAPALVDVDAGGPEATGIRPVWSVAAIKNATDSQAVEAAAVAAADTIASPAFRRHLEAIEELEPELNASATTGPEVANIYLGLQGTAHQFRSNYLTSTKNCNGLPLVHFGASTALTGLDAETKTATTTLHSCVVTRARARGSSVAEFACAVNTLAHEWTHTIPRPDKPTEWLYKDKGHAQSQLGLVSYTVGALAQCVYLDSQGYRVEEKFDACMKAVGTTVFNAVPTCSDAWALKTFGKR